MDRSAGIADVAPLPYHRRTVEYLRSEEHELWEWFASANVQAEEAERVRLELLKSTYRLEEGAHADLYALARNAASVLGVGAPLTLYQAQRGGEPNASLAFLPDEAHIVLSGDLRGRLETRELQSVLAHELAHYLFASGFDREFLIARDILAALANDENAAPVFDESLRLFSLHTEIFCDRGALAAVGDLGAVVTALLKILTGTNAVDADSYLRQAREIFACGPTPADGITHPEVFIRAYTLECWQEKRAEADPLVESILRGPPRFERLDLIARSDLAALTRRLVERFLRPSWLQTEALLAHARLFDVDLAATTTAGSELALELRFTDRAVREYLAFVLLDLAAAERQLEDLPLAAAISLSDELGFGGEFRAVAARDLPVTKKRLARVAAQAEELLRAAAAQPGKHA